MGPNAFCQLEGADFENRCYTGIFEVISLFFMFEVSFVRR